MQVTTRTSEGLRSTLFDTLDKFLNGEIDHLQAKTIAKLSDSLLKSVAIDLEYKRLIREITATGENKDISNLGLNIMMAPPSASGLTSQL